MWISEQRGNRLISVEWRVTGFVQFPAAVNRRAAVHDEKPGDVWKGQYCQWWQGVDPGALCGGGVSFLCSETLLHFHALQLLHHLPARSK